MDTIDQLYQQLSLLESQRNELDKKIETLRQEIARHSPFSKADKIALFRQLFIGNTSAYAQHWISKDGLKSGYAPVTRTFRGKDYLPVDDRAIQLHLEGKIRMGTYAIFDQRMCRFLAIDLDKGSFLADARAIGDVAESMGITPCFELSKSGNGIHAWIFFTEPVPARDARILGDLIISRAMDRSEGIDMQSFDRFFPNQDYVAPDALGNLIALPLHYKSRQEGKTVFVDLATMQPYPDPWRILRTAHKLTPQRLHELTADYARATEASSLMPWEVRKEPIQFPRTVRMVLHDALYLERTDLPTSLLNLLKRMASFYNPEFFIRQKQRLSTYKTPRIVSSFELNERYIVLPRGLLEKLIQFFDKHQVTVQIEDKRHGEAITQMIFYLKLRPEQQKAAKAILRHDYALLIAPPGFGKTAVATSVITSRSVSTLILVHKAALLEQWITRLSEYLQIDSKEIGMLGKGKKKLNGHLDVATLQSLRNRPELIEDYTQIVVDEAHHIPAVSFEIPLKRFRGRYVIGLSATPKRKDGMEAIMYLQCGEVAYTSRRDSSVRHLLKTLPTEFDTFSDHFATMLGEIAEDQERNRLIIDEVARHPSRKILILSERIEHLNILWHLLDENGHEAIILHGSLSTREKRTQLKAAQQASILLSTSSYIGEGIDISHLDTIVFTMPISYPERIIQYLGRIGRQGQTCLAIDLIDRHVPMLKSTFNKRMSGYRKMGYTQVKDRGLFE